MHDPFRLSIALCLTLLLWFTPAFAQEADDDEADDDKTIAELTENSDRYDGLFTLYRDRDTGETHMAIMPGQLDREYIYFAVSTDGVVEGGHFCGNYRDNRVVSIGRHFDRIEIRAENAAFYFNPENPLSRAADANISPGVLASEPILAEDETTGAMLIAADELFASETLLQVKPTTLNEMMKRYGIGPRRRRGAAGSAASIRKTRIQAGAKASALENASTDDAADFAQVVGKRLR